MLTNHLIITIKSFKEINSSTVEPKNDDCQKVIPHCYVIIRNQIR